MAQGPTAKTRMESPCSISSCSITAAETSTASGHCSSRCGDSDQASWRLKMVQGWFVSGWWMGKWRLIGGYWWWMYRFFLPHLFNRWFICHIPRNVRNCNEKFFSLPIYDKSQSPAQKFICLPWRLAVITSINPGVQVIISGLEPYKIWEWNHVDGQALWKDREEKTRIDLTI